MRKLDFTKDALKFLQDLDAKRFKQIANKILSLCVDATPNDSSNLKGSDKRRADIGEFRIIYHFDAECVYISVIGKRNDDEVYR